MRIDLHTHSRVSDGTDSPAELVRAAAGAGLDVVAITDHDTADSWPEAVEAAREVGITLVRGLEISTRHGRSSVHLLAYLPDPTHPELAALLRAILDGRTSRTPLMVDKLQALGIAITLDQVRAVSGSTAAAGRPHVADALVRLGRVPDRSAAFTELLNPGMPAYVDRYAAPTDQAVRAVVAAGGVPVIAHPWGRSGRRQPDAVTLAALQESGLAGIEVDHQDHDGEARALLRGIAGDLDLLVTGSSDYHGLGKVDHDLGCNTTAPEVYEQLLALAAAAAARSGRDTPEVLTA